MTSNEVQVSKDRARKAIERLRDEGATIEGELYVVLLRGAKRRIALIARRNGGSTEYIMEVQLRLVSPEPGREMEGLSPAAEETMELIVKGYLPGKQEEAWTCCEKSIAADALENELESLLESKRVN